MSRRISGNTKNIRGMGKGKGKDYKPYITTSEFNSQGTISIIKDWKTNRGVHCLSQGEALWYYILRWDDKIVTFDRLVDNIKKLGGKPAW